MDEHITIDRSTIKALAIESRLNILKLLYEKQRTATELAEELGMGASTISEHVTKLIEAGLISKEKTKRKWKYYSLTNKGKVLVNPVERKVMFSLFASLGAMVVLGIVKVRQWLDYAANPVASAKQTVGIASVKSAPTTAADESGAVIAEYAAPLAERELTESTALATQQSTSVLDPSLLAHPLQLDLIWIALLFFLLVIVFCLGYRRAKKILVLNK